jgi:hypothetical protein
MYKSIDDTYDSSTGANLDILLKVNPYFMKMNGTGIATVATAPKIDIAGPTPKLWNIGFATSGNAAAKTLLRNVFAETALAAYRPYVSTRKLIHCWKRTLNPAPMKAAANTGDTHRILGVAVQPNQKSPIAKRTAPIAIGRSRPSGTGLPLAASEILAYRD